MEVFERTYNQNRVTLHLQGCLPALERFPCYTDFKPKLSAKKTVQIAVQNDHILPSFHAMLLAAPLELNMGSIDLLLRFFACCCMLSSLLPVVAAAAHKKTSAQQRQQQQTNGGGTASLAAILQAF